MSLIVPFVWTIRVLTISLVSYMVFAELRYVKAREQEVAFRGSKN